MFARRAAFLALVSLVSALVPFATTYAAPPHGGGSAVVLRYRFVAGQTLTYHIMISAQGNLSGSGLPGSTGSTGTAAPAGIGGNGLAHLMARRPSTAAGNSLALLFGHVATTAPLANGVLGLLQLATRASAGASVTVTINGTVHEHVMQVDAQGGATVEVGVSFDSVMASTNGQSKTLTLPAVPTQTIHVAADGSQQGTVSGANGLLSLQSTGAFPHYPVAPGARWTTQQTSSVPAVSGNAATPIQAMTENVFSGYEQLNGELIAIIDSSQNLQVSQDVTASGQTLHLQETGLTTGRTLFGLESGQLAAANAHSSLQLLVQGQSTSGKSVSVRAQIALNVSTQRVS